MRLASIASGSSGNCVYVGSDATHLLIDAGIGKKRIEEGLRTLSLSLRDIDAILITHEHTDHIAGLRTILKTHDIPVYATDGTIGCLCGNGAKRVPGAENFFRIRADERLTIKDLTVVPFAISHDAAEPVAFRISYGRKRIGVATDLGSYDDYTVAHLREADALMLEANHDVRMLQAGPYPYYLKQRILGSRGHLSNERSGALLCSLLHDRLKGVLLGHLSDKNNLPELAYETVRLAIEMGDNGYHGDDFALTVAERGSVSPVIQV